MSSDKEKKSMEEKQSEASKQERVSLFAAQKAQAYVERLFPVACNLVASAVQGTGALEGIDNQMILKAFEVAEKMMDVTGQYREELLKKFQEEQEQDVKDVAPTLASKGFVVPDLNSFRDDLPSAPRL